MASPFANKQFPYCQLYFSLHSTPIPSKLIVCCICEWLFVVVNIFVLGKSNWIIFIACFHSKRKWQTLTQTFKTMHKSGRRFEMKLLDFMTHTQLQHIEKTKMPKGNDNKVTMKLWQIVVATQPNWKKKTNDKIKRWIVTCLPYVEIERNSLQAFERFCTTTTAK